MVKSLKSVLAGVAVGAVAVGYAAPASASGVPTTLLSASTSGLASATASGVTAGFYSVSYSGEAGRAIKSITYDMSGDFNTFSDGAGGTYQSTSYFNFDTGEYGNLGPVIDPTSGVSPGTICTGVVTNGVSCTWSHTSTDLAYDPSTMPNSLTFNFADGVFNIGDKFSFGADAEWVNGYNLASARGGDFGAASIPLAVTFYGGSAPVSANFVQQSTTLSTLSVSAPAAVPLPSAVWLFGSGLVGLAGLARRRKAA